MRSHKHPTTRLGVCPPFGLGVVLAAGCTGGPLGEGEEGTGAHEQAAATADANTTQGAKTDPEPTPTSTDSNTTTSTTPPTPKTPQTPSLPFNCDEAAYPVCDGFETVAAGSPPNPKRWNSQVALPPPGDGAVHSDHPAQNTIQVSDKMAHTGSHSLHFHSSPGWAHLPIEAITSSAYPKAFLPAPSGNFFVRMWVYNDGLAGDHSVSVASGHWYMVNASGPLGGRQQYQKLGGGGATLGWNYFGNDEGLGSNVPLPTGKWICLETQFKKSSNELFVWVDDKAVDSLHSSAWAAPDYNRLTIGWEMDHPDGNYPGVDIYIDDVAYSYTRIGCAVPTP